MLPGNKTLAGGDVVMSKQRSEKEETCCEIL